MTAPPDTTAVATIPALLSVATVAALLDCSPRTVRRGSPRVELPAVLDHGRVMVRGDDLAAYIDRLERVGAAGQARRATPAGRSSTSCDDPATRPLRLPAVSADTVTTRRQAPPRRWNGRGRITGGTR